MKNIAWSLAAGVLVLSGWAIPSRADDITPGACKADVEKLCTDVQPGGGRIVACMKQHEADLSDACKQNIAIKRQDAKAKIQAFAAACGSDMQKFCSDVKPGAGRMIVCMKDHQADLSSACQAKVSKLKAPPAATPAGN